MPSNLVQVYITKCTDGQDSFWSTRFCTTFLGPLKVSSDSLFLFFGFSLILNFICDLQTERLNIPVNLEWQSCLRRENIMIISIKTHRDSLLEGSNLVV